MAAFAPIVASCRGEETTKVVEVPVEGGGVETKVLERDTPCQILLTDGLKAGKDVECGHVVSPLVHATPAKGSIRVAYFRVKAKDGKGRKPPVFFHFGGPGDDGTNPMRVAMRLRRELGSDRDLVAIGQRGTTYSLAIPSCDDPDPLDSQTPDGIAADLARAASGCKAALDASGVDVRAFDTTSAVRDVEALRVGLGYATIAFHGISYGATFGIELARQFPTTIHRLVLDSILPPDFERAAYFVDQFEDMLGFMRSFRASCDTKLPACKAAFGGTVPDFAADYEKVLADSATKPVLPAMGVSARAFEFLTLSRGAGMSENARVVFAYLMHGLANRTGLASPSGIDTGVEASLEKLRSGLGVGTPADELLVLLLGGNGGGEPDGFSLGLNDALGCSEIFNVKAAEVETVLGRTEYAALGPAFKAALGVVAKFEEARCAPWRPIFDARLKSFGKAYKVSAPAVLVNSSFDTATPLKYANKALASFPKGTLTESSCTAHGVLVAGLSGQAIACTASLLRLIVDEGAFEPSDLACLCKGG